MMIVLWAIALFAGTASSRCSAPLEVGNNSLWAVVGVAPSQDALTNVGELCETGVVGAAPEMVCVIYCSGLNAFSPDASAAAPLADSFEGPSCALLLHGQLPVVGARPHVTWCNCTEALEVASLDASAAATPTRTPTDSTCPKLACSVVGGVFFDFEATHDICGHRLDELGRPPDAAALLRVTANSTCHVMACLPVKALENAGTATHDICGSRLDELGRLPDVLRVTADSTCSLTACLAVEALDDAVDDKPTLPADSYLVDQWAGSDRSLSHNYYFDTLQTSDKNFYSNSTNETHRYRRKIPLVNQLAHPPPDTPHRVNKAGSDNGGSNYSSGGFGSWGGWPGGDGRRPRGRFSSGDKADDLLYNHPTDVPLWPPTRPDPFHPYHRGILFYDPGVQNYSPYTFVEYNETLSITEADLDRAIECLGHDCLFNAINDAGLPIPLASDPATLREVSGVSTGLPVSVNGDALERIGGALGGRAVVVFSDTNATIILGNASSGNYLCLYTTGSGSLLHVIKAAIADGTRFIDKDPDFFNDKYLGCADDMETDGDAADQLVRGMHAEFLPYLEDFLRTDLRTRLTRRDPAAVLRHLFTPDQLQSLLADSQQGDTSLWDSLWNMATPRPQGLSIRYALYLVDGSIEGPNKDSYDAFVKAFAACKFPNHLVDDPQWNSDGSWKIRVAGVGEGLDGQRRSHYFYMPEGELKEWQVKKLGESIIKAMQYAAEQTRSVGVRWGVEFRTLKKFSRDYEKHKPEGLSSEAALIGLVQSYARGITFFNMQFGDNRIHRFATLFVYHFKNAGHVEGGYPLKRGTYERDPRWAHVFAESDDDQAEPVLTDEPEEEEPLERDYEMKNEQQIVETLILASDDQVEYEVLVAVAEASVGLTFRFSVVHFLAELIKAAVARNEKPPFAVIDAQQVARARMTTGLRPALTYKLLFSNDGRALRDALVVTRLVEAFETPDDDKIEASYKSLLLAAGPPAFLEALRAVPVVFSDEAGFEVLAAVRRHKPSYGRRVDQFLEALIRLRTTSDGVLEELFADAIAVAAARCETGAWPCFYEWLLDERGAAVRRLLSENGVPCTERVALDKVDDAYAADLLRREPSPLYEALKQLDPGADLELADEVRVACNSLNSKGWKWKGREGLEPYLEVLIGLLKDRSDGLLACAERLARARRERPAFRDGHIKALLDAEGDAGTTIRAALAGAGANVDTLVSWTDVKAASDALEAEETALYQAVVAVGLVRDGTAATIVAMRGLVGGRKEGGLQGVQWARLDCVLAAALPLAVERSSDSAGLRLFDAETLADALFDSGEKATHLYNFLKLLEDGGDDARDVRAKLVAIGLDAGEYPAATRGQVMSALADKRKAAREADEKKRKAAAEPSPQRTRRDRRGGLRNHN